MPDEPHDQAEELLPWYATGQLDPADRMLVESHLSSCARCQRQLGVERQLIDEFHLLEPRIDTGWALMRARVAPQTARPSRIPSAIRDVWALLRRPAVATLAVAQIAFLIMAGTVLMSLSRPSYRALGSPSATPTANIIVMFRPEATEEDIRETLRARDASLVGGPTLADAYLLQVPANRRAAALMSLQSDDDVQMAEPIDGAAQ